MVQTVRVLIVGGATGYLGQILYDYLSHSTERDDVKLHVRVTTRAPPVAEHQLHLNLLDPASITAALEAFSPDVVINTAAISQPAVCERDEETTNKTNVPKFLVHALENTPTLLIHISTDQVFDGTSANSSESTPANPINAYGRSKLAAEKYILRSQCSSVILRSSILVGPEVPGVQRPLFVQFIRDQLQGKKETSYLSDEWRNPIYVKDVCRFIEWFVLEGAKGTKFRETFNMGGPERLSRLDMAHAVAAAMGVNGEGLIIPCASSDLHRTYSSPRDISMDSSALLHRTKIKCTAFQDMIRDIL
jgi:dTDP-4-dehydrorhamnose reductase